MIASFLLTNHQFSSHFFRNVQHFRVTSLCISTQCFCMQMCLILQWGARCHLKCCYIYVVFHFFCHLFRPSVVSKPTFSIKWHLMISSCCGLIISTQNLNWRPCIWPSSALGWNQVNFPCLEYNPKFLSRLLTITNFVFCYNESAPEEWSPTLFLMTPPSHGREN